MARSSAPRPPSVDRLVAAIAARNGADGRDREAVVRAAREVIATERARMAAGAGARPLDELAALVMALLVDWGSPAGRATPVINATGVILHTNLGRAPWARQAIEAATAAAAGYSLLELDRETGRRGRRSGDAEDHLVALTGAEDALVTTNNAAAIALAVALAGRRGVAVARGELVEIGGGVRIPEIIRRAGARLVEVGTTNRTRVADFEEVLEDGRARLVLRVHPSNFRIVGFTAGPDPTELAEVAHRHGAIVVDDLGSGALVDTAAVGLTHEPMPAERLAAGADLVTFSGDKLLGGPQSGLIVGRADLVARIRRDPLARASRPDKVTLAALAATLGLYRAGLAHAEIPVLRMLSTPVRDLEARAGRLVASAADAAVTVTALEATVGGGSLAGEVLPSAGLRVAGPSADRLAGALRVGDPAVVGRVADDAVLLDLRTVSPDEDEALAAALQSALRRTRSADA
ncbi:MAG TPA: L-seryl-tRNA(Sec) selenium transferase [Candidatus Limnocylindrales bacterium]|nr:L-seryl-tRNA(Sec) selenium transferase [Candidatus Limnocylindrales bacterium]